VAHPEAGFAQKSGYRCGQKSGHRVGQTLGRMLERSFGQKLGQGLAQKALTGLVVILCSACAGEQLGPVVDTASGALEGVYSPHAPDVLAFRAESLMLPRRSESFVSGPPRSRWHGTETALRSISTRHVGRP
jgi:hypothetical protein